MTNLVAAISRVTRRPRSGSARRLRDRPTTFAPSRHGRLPAGSNSLKRDECRSLSERWNVLSDIKGGEGGKGEEGKRTKKGMRVLDAGPGVTFFHDTKRETSARERNLSLYTAAVAAQPQCSPLRANAKPYSRNGKVRKKGERERTSVYTCRIRAYTTV